MVNKKDASQNTVNAHYVKSPSFNEHPLHGIYGGMSTEGRIFMALFSERLPIPQEVSIEYTVDDEGHAKLMSEQKPVSGKEGIVRLVHGVYHLDINMAKAMRDWLEVHISTFKDLPK